jgi:hypothetical protein
MDTYSAFLAANTGIVSFYLARSAMIACIWLSVWAIRRKADVDYPLDGFAQTVRWGVVVLGFTFGYLTSLKYGRLVGFNLGLIFLCWPNFGYHLANLLRPRRSSDF